MWWYIAFSAVFTIYAVDLVVTFVTSFVANAYFWFYPHVTTQATRAAAKHKKQMEKAQREAAKYSKEANLKENPMFDLGLDRMDRMELDDSESSSQEDKDASPSKQQLRAVQPVKPLMTNEYAHLISLYNGDFPKVVVQLPMYNEDAHAELVIARCCRLQWPSHRILIQVCDDSTNEEIKKRIDCCALSHQERGHNVMVVRRESRVGFKAGALVEGMKRYEGLGYEFAAIFDADFEPPPDFLYQTIIHLMLNPKVGFVQTRWVFKNGSDGLLTWAQRVNLEFHFLVEQQVRYFANWFFNFNGTAGVWRVAAIQDAGGWESDTVVEDMDLSLRTYLRGWTCVYLPDVVVPNELPSTLSAYKTQQFRWLGGPMQIVRKSFKNIWASKRIGFLQKLNCYWFFVRYLQFGLVTLVALLAPPIVMWLDPWHLDWSNIYFLVSANIAVAVYLYFSIFSIIYMIFSVATGYFKLWAMMSGLLGLKKSKTWKVTAKYNAQGSSSLLRNYHKPYLIEFVLYIYYGVMLAFSYWYKMWYLAAYDAIMALAFLIIAFGDYFL